MNKNSIGISLFFTFCIYIFLGNSIAFSNQPKTLKKIVIDAGHGGKDAGALKYKLSKNEKDITLDVALLLGEMIQKHLKDVEVIYTRKVDKDVDLKDRHAIANKANADLFLSIHVNSTAPKSRKVNGRWVRDRETQASGTETFVLGLHRVGQKSKAFEEYGEQIVQEPGLLDPSDPMTQIIVSNYTQAFLSRSIVFADKIEQNFIRQGRNSRGVKQLGLEVLAGSAMPGVLVELGFINNVEDEIYMNSKEGQKEMAQAIFQAIVSYKRELEKGIAN